MAHNDCWVRRTSCKKTLPPPADNERHSAQWRMRSAKQISMNCCSVCIFFVFLMKDDDDKGMRVLIVAESRKEGKNTELLLWNIQGVVVCKKSQVFVQKYCLIFAIRNLMSLNPACKELGQIHFLLLLSVFNVYSVICPARNPANYDKRRWLEYLQNVYHIKLKEIAFGKFSTSEIRWQCGC